jgi:hypothetical protein
MSSRKRIRSSSAGDVEENKMEKAGSHQPLASVAGEERAFSLLLPGSGFHGKAFTAI